MKYEIVLDIYVFGAWIEIEGEECGINFAAKKLGFGVSDYNTDSADDIYLNWIKKFGLKEMWDVRFGLGGGR